MEFWELIPEQPNDYTIDGLKEIKSLKKQGYNFYTFVTYRTYYDIMSKKHVTEVENYIYPKLIHPSMIEGLCNFLFFEEQERLNKDDYYIKRYVTIKVFKGHFKVGGKYGYPLGNSKFYFGKHVLTTHCKQYGNLDCTPIKEIAIPNCRCKECTEARA